MAKPKKESFTIKSTLALTLIGCLLGAEIGCATNLGTTNLSFAAITSPTKNQTNLFLNDKNIQLKNAPLTLENTLMVPALQMLQHMGIQTKSLNGGTTVIGYRNNVFLKFQKGSTEGYRNGKSVRLAQAPILRQGILYVPLNFIVNAYHYETTDGPHALYLKSPDGNGRFTLLDNVYYKTVNLPSLDVNFAIPDYWEKKDKTGIKYGYKDEYETVTLDVSSYKTQAIDMSAVIENFITGKMGSQSDMTVQTVEKIRISELEAAAITSVRKLGTKNDVTSDYLIRQGNTIFNLHFRIQGKPNTNDTKSIFKNIARSFKVNSLSVDYDQEYYLEYDNFNKYGFKPTSDLYSSQLVDSVLQVKGTVNPSLPYNKLIAIVTKGQNYSYFTIPVRKGKFSGNIYTPFGLGKHNITLVLAPTVLSSSSYPQLVNDPRAKVLELSIINTATRDITFLIPSSKINSDDPEIVNIANLQTYKSMTRLEKAKNIFQWLISNITLERRFGGRSAVDVFKGSRGTEEEVNFLYAALLRSIGTPARVVKGDVKGHTTYWTEIQFNGIWVVSDLPRAIQASSKSESSSAAYFSLDLRKYYEKHENIHRLEY